MSEKTTLPIVAEILGRDRLELSLQNGEVTFTYVGCEELHRLISELKQKHGQDLKKWPIPTGEKHAELLVREFLLKVSGQWKPPYAADELCHCRFIPTETVHQAILSGATTTDRVSRWTSASTACGTCRPVVQDLIDYQLGRTK